MYCEKQEGIQSLGIRKYVGEFAESKKCLSILSN